MMRVLGSEAAADPTAIEQEVRQQMLERQQVRNSIPSRMLIVAIECFHCVLTLCFKLVL